MSYAELFCQSNFSFLTGASHPEELVLQANFLGYHAIAITDECSLAGVVRAHSAIQQHQLSIKQIVGSVFKLNDECRFVLLCPNRQAYAELCRVITNARRRCEKGQYQLSEWDILSLKHCFVIWLPLGKSCDYSWGKWLQRYHASRLWLGLQRHLRHDDAVYQHHCQQLATQLDLPITACGGVLMHRPERLPLQHTLTAIRHGCTVEQLGPHRLVNAEQSLRSENKLRKLFKPQWLAESIAIAQQCTFELSSLRYEHPSELIPNGYTPDSYLAHLVEQGKKRVFLKACPKPLSKPSKKSCV